MNIRGIYACAATMAFLLLAGCSSPPVEPVVAVETEDPHTLVWHDDDVPRIDLGPVVIHDLNLYAPTIADLGPAEVFLSGSRQTNKTYLRYANLVPTDLYGTREQQLAWYESNAVCVDNYAPAIFGGSSLVNDFDPSLWAPDQLPVRIPDSDPTPTP